MPAAPPPDARSRRLAEALRANLRRRKAPSAEAPSPAPQVGDGAEDGEGLYPPGPGAPAPGRRA